jgi:hypothetical protein
MINSPYYFQAELAQTSGAARFNPALTVRLFGKGTGCQAFFCPKNPRQSRLDLDVASDGIAHGTLLCDAILIAIRTSKLDHSKFQYPTGSGACPHVQILGTRLAASCGR